MNKVKYSFFLVVLLLLMSSRTFSILGGQLYAQGVFEDGEELYYEVSYSFINIGWAKFTTERTGIPGIYITKARLKSNDGLPLVNIDYEFISEVEVKSGIVKPLNFTAYQFLEGKRITITHVFDYDSNYIDIKKTELDGSVSVNKRMYTSAIYQDGLSIFYFARLNSGRNSSQTVPVIMHVDSARMNVDFSDKRTDVSIGEADYDIASTLVEGFSHFKAVFGLTGEFSGWFSVDDAKIPLKAKLQVEIGNITLELKSWKRKSWSPPKY